MKALFQVVAAVIAALVVGFGSYSLGVRSRLESVPVGFMGSKQNMEFAKPLVQCTNNCDFHLHVAKMPKTTTIASCDTSDYSNCIRLNHVKVVDEPGTCDVAKCGYEANVVLEWRP